MINVKKKILVADDDYMLLHSMRFALRSRGYEVTIVTNGISALYKILGKKDLFDLLITDVKMPLCDGIQLLDEISKQNIPIPVITISAYDESSIVELVKSKGCEKFITKPFSSMELIRTINAIFTNQSNINSTQFKEV